MLTHLSTCQDQLTIGEIEPLEYAVAEPNGGRSFLQLPNWAAVKSDWSSELLAWRDASGQVVGTTLVLFRRMPGLSRWYAYLPEGPDIDWADPSLGRWFDPLLSYLERRDAFAVRIGPPPALRRWQPATLKGAAGPGRRVHDVLPDVVEPLGSAVADRLRSLGWRRCGEGGLGNDAQPRFLFQVPIAGQSVDGLWSRLSKEWQRNIRRH